MYLLLGQRFLVLLSMMPNVQQIFWRPKNTLGLVSTQANRRAREPETGRSHKEPESTQPSARTRPVEANIERCVHEEEQAPGYGWVNDRLYATCVRCIPVNSSTQKRQLACLDGMQKASRDCELVVRCQCNQSPRRSVAHQPRSRSWFDKQK